MSFIKTMQIKKQLKQQENAEREKKAAKFDRFHEGKTPKKKGFLEVVKQEFEAGKKVYNDITGNTPEARAAKIKKLKENTALLKAQKEYAKAKGTSKPSSYGSQSAFSGSTGGGYSIGSSKPAFSGSIGTAYSIGTPKTMKKPVKKRKSKRKGKTVTITYS